MGRNFLNLKNIYNIDNNVKVSALKNKKDCMFIMTSVPKGLKIEKWKTKIIRRWKIVGYMTNFKLLDRDQKQITQTILNNSIK